MIVLGSEIVAFATLSLVIIGIGGTSGFISCDFMLVKELHKSKIKSM